MKRAKRLIIYISALATVVVGAMIAWHASVYIFATGRTENGIMFFTALIGISVVITGLNAMILKEPDREE